MDNLTIVCIVFGVGVLFLGILNIFLIRQIEIKNIDIQGYKEIADELRRTVYQIGNNYRYLLKKHYELGEELEAYKKMLKVLRQMYEQKTEKKEK